jgi:hypothetical protein
LLRCARNDGLGNAGDEIEKPRRTGSSGQARTMTVVGVAMN